MVRVVLASWNPGKATQIKAIFAGSSIEILTLDELGFKEEEGIEDGESIYDNAWKKALFAWQKTGLPSVADDSGLFISALGGLPGHRAARWAGEAVPGEKTTHHTLRVLQGFTDRSATFRTIAAFINPDGPGHAFVGEVRGTILEAPRTPPEFKMPYSGIFKPDCTNLVFAQMDIDVENLISHRGQAFRKVRTFLDHLYR